MNRDIKFVANLNVLRRRDPSISRIIDSASHVVLYQYPDMGSGAWTKMNIEGAMFLFERDIAPKYGLCILNRLSTSNFHVPLTSDLIVHVVEDYLMFRSTNSSTLGVWFFDKTDRLRIVDQVLELCKQESLLSTDPETLNAAQAFLPIPTSNTRKPGGKKSKPPSSPPPESKSGNLLASAQSDLMGLVARARQTSSNASPPVSRHPPPMSEPSVPSSSVPNDDMSRLIAKLSMGTSVSTPTPVPTVLSSNVATNPPAFARPPPSDRPVDPFRLANSVMHHVPGNFPPGIPSRDILRDELVARLSGDPMFLDSIYQYYLMSLGMPLGMAIAPPNSHLPPGAMHPAMHMPLGPLHYRPPMPASVNAMGHPHAGNPALSPPSMNGLPPGFPTR